MKQTYCLFLIGYIVLENLLPRKKNSHQTRLMGVQMHNIFECSISIVITLEVDSLPVAIVLEIWVCLFV